MQVDFLVLRCPRPRPRGLQSPRSSAAKLAPPARNINIKILTFNLTIIFHILLINWFAVIEIIILAIISFFLFKKLKSMLGDEYDDEMFGYGNETRKEKKRKIKDAEQVHEEEKEKSELESGDYNYLSAEALKNADTLRDEIGGFTLNRFKRIATKVLETVIKANEEQKKDEIKQFMTSELAEAVLASFAGENRNHIVLVSLDEAKIVDITKLGNQYCIDMKFKMQQINYTTNKDGEIIDGDKKEIINVCEKWSFIHTLGKKDATWFISKIEEFDDVADGGK